MIRRLVDYKKLDHQLAALLIETYPHGYGDDDIIVFTNANGEYVQAVEIRTEDSIYLVKISKSLANFISNFEDTIERELEDKQEPVLEEVDSIDLDGEMNPESEIDEELDSD
ncbi:hypothetical protein FK220_012630 [Flavobacteriaceae bacterium TP-CH-4]|uniref:Uncharacterized protein n=1 Tax=Pelagihabitans pacificus TaxID=2696054 RepID=A0A967AZ25_9FLAO|nr:hypothetical protein [Pelagihabitans pacificus]NHF60192.1 hypothetical protein [Pelagihabitans pacificus]